MKFDELPNLESFHNISDNKLIPPQPARTNNGHTSTEIARWRRCGLIWTIQYGDEHGQFPDRCGFFEIGQLLLQPATTLALPEVAKEGALLVEDLKHEAAQPMFDEESLQSLYEAGKSDDDVVRFLRQSTRPTASGLRSKDFSTDIKRLINMIDQRIRRIMCRVEDVMPNTGRHLHNCIRTIRGGFIYRPDRPIVWNPSIE